MMHNIRFCFLEIVHVAKLWKEHCADLEKCWRWDLIRENRRWYSRTRVTRFIKFSIKCLQYNDCNSTRGCKPFFLTRTSHNLAYVILWFYTMFLILIQEYVFVCRVVCWSRRILVMRRELLLRRIHLEQFLELTTHLPLVVHKDLVSILRSQLAFTLEKSCFCRTFHICLIGSRYSTH